MPGVTKGQVILETKQLLTEAAALMDTIPPNSTTGREFRDIETSCQTHACGENR